VAEIEKVIVGQSPLIFRIVVAMLADGHVLLEGVPGLAKTLLVSALGAAMGGIFRRIQMVPDMLPSDLIGTYLYVGNRFKLQKGPLIDCHVALVDEINRAPAKTQAALLQAMQERQVTVMGKETLDLPDPFIVLATQNPVEQDTMALRDAARVEAFLHNRQHVYPEDIQAVARDVLRHRIFLEFSAEAEGLTVEAVIQEILDGVHIP